MLRRKFITNTSIGTTSIFLGGCETTKLFSDYYYFEDVSTLLVSMDGMTVAFISQNYHYVFKTDKTIRFSLNPKNHKFIKGEIKNVTVERDGTCILDYYIILTKDAPQDMVNEAFSNGFSSAVNEAKAYVLGTILGERFSGNQVQPTGQTTPLNKNHFVRIKSKQSTKEFLSNAKKSPITLAVDGVIFVGAIATFPIMWPFILGSAK